MPKIINTGSRPTIDATVSGHATQMSIDSYPLDKPKPTSGGGGTK